MASIGNYDLDDVDGRQQASESLVDRARESGALAVLDLLVGIMGFLADEPGFMDRVRAQSLEMEQPTNDTPPRRIGCSAIIVTKSLGDGSRTRSSSFGAASLWLLLHGSFGARLGSSFVPE